MGKKLILALFAAFACIAAAAQNTIRVEVPDVVAADEQFNVTFIIEGENSPSSFSWEPGSEFQLVWGPQKGSSTSISIINGKRTRSAQTTYTYVLMPKKAGSFAIAAAHAEVKGNSISSSPKSINVVSGGSRSQSSGSSSAQNSGGNDPRQTGDIPADDLFMRLTLSRTSVVVGEPVTATLKLYHRTNIAGFEDAHFPSFNGFWSQEIQAPQNIEFKRESLNDAIYNSAVLRSWTLIPQQAGDIKIDPAELICLVNVRAPSRGNSIFDSFFQDEYRTIRKRVSTSAATVHVSKLPAGAPDSFGGGVGKFNISASVNRDSLQAHDAASLTVAITGSGNLSLLEAPKVSFPSDFEVYDVKVKDGGNGKSFEYPFIPRSHGEFTIPAIEYSFYDISAGKYVTVSTDPILMKVARGTNTGNEGSGSLSQAGNGVIRKDVRDLGSDIRYISTRLPHFAKKGSFFVASPLFIILLVLLLAFAAAAWFIMRSMAARRADVVGARNRGAVKMAGKRLARAGDYLKNGLPTAFYEELHKTLIGFISDKLNIDLADMSRENIAQSLTEAGVSSELAEQFNGLLDACEFARYAPDSGNDSMNTHYETALAVISSIDSSMKGKKSGSAKAAGAILALLMVMPWNAIAAGSDDALWQSGCEAYSTGDWETALHDWESISDMGLESPELYYNIGNAWYKSGDIAHAILNYERALKLDPSYDDARFNLEFANASVQDRIETVPVFFLKQWRDAISRTLSSDTWTVLFLIMLAGALAGLLSFLLASSTGKRKLGFFGGIALAILSLICIDFSIGQKNDYRRQDSAIVMRPVTSVKSSPSGDSAKDLFILHEGTKVKVLESVRDWDNISLSDGRQGWIPSRDIEII